MPRFPLIPALAIAVAVGAGYLALQDGTEITSGSVTGVPQVPPQPGGPPVVWVSGSLEEIAASFLMIREGEGASIRLHRLAAGASRFFRVKDGRWQELPPEEADQVQAGERACAEALLDGTTFVALRVFLGASGCGPA
ncbi:MAG TPA: hypothetical protein VGZ50_02095 [Actinomycetota bacterium]|nr:hypothetical protein [Actinomycetota bacterium]